MTDVILYHMMCFDQREHTNYMLGYEIQCMNDYMTGHDDMAWHEMT